MLPTKVYRPLILLFILVLSISLTAQNHNNFWIFGPGAGLDFNTSPPTPLSNTAIDATEANSAISDPNGNLLFYTDGRTIYNKEHSIMENGEGLLGGERSAQTLIVKPGGAEGLLSSSYNNLYYIFTTDDSFPETGPLEDGLRYSIVDMSLEEGMGAVIEKNILLEESATEKLEAVYHENEADIWIIAHRYGSNQFLSYLLTLDGLEETPIVSSTGLVYGNDPSVDFMQAEGYLTANLQGTMLVSMFNGGFGNDGFSAEIFPFNNATGVVGTRLHLLSGEDFFDVYGAAFSPDGTKLYINNGPLTEQLDLTHGNDAAIWENRVSLFLEAGAIANSPDGCKIYMVTGYMVNTIHVIENPDELCPDCNLVIDAIEIPEVMSTFYGVPTQLNQPTVIGCGLTNASEISKDDQIKIAPNPVIDQLNIELKEPIESLHIFDATGKLIYVQDFPNSNPNLTINLSNWNAGLYFLIIKSENGKLHSNKFVKQ